MINFIKNLVILFFIGFSMSLFSQRLNVNKKVEFSTEQSSDVNCIIVPTKNVSVDREVVREEISEDDIKQASDHIKNVRYRKKRVVSDKCQKKYVVKSHCDSSNVKKILNKSKLKK